VVYELASTLPHSERYILVPQLKRAAWSVHNNIAEGNAKLGRREMRRFFDTAIGSLAEVDAMVSTAAKLYDLPSNLVVQVEDLRMGINRGLFGILSSSTR